MAEPPLFAMQLNGFTAGARLQVAHGSFRNIGFGGNGLVVKYDPHHLELDLRVTKLLFHLDVVLRFKPDGEGNVSFWGGRPDGKTTGSEPAHVKHIMTIKSQSPDGSVFEFPFEDRKTGVTDTRVVAVRKTQAKGADALKLTYDRFELTLAPKR